MSDGIPMSFLRCPAKFCAMCHPCLSSAFHVLPDDVSNAILYVKENKKEGETISGTEPLCNFYACMEPDMEQFHHFLCQPLLIELCVFSILL